MLPHLDTILNLIHLTGDYVSEEVCYRNVQATLPRPALVDDFFLFSLSLSVRVHCIKGFAIDVEREDG